MLGARMHYAVPRLLHEAGLLEHFFTDSYIGNKPALQAVLRALPAQLAGAGVKRWLGRDEPRLPPQKVTSFETLGIRYALERRHARNAAQMEAIFARTAARFNTAILRRNKAPAGFVWGFNTAALELFEAARQNGARCILEQTILPRRLEAELLTRQAQQWEGWQPGFSARPNGGLQAEREEREWALAERIVAGSDFVRDGLLACGVPADKISVIPYGVDVTRFSPAPPQERDPARPLRVLFVGEVGLRKGVPWLLEALKTLGPERVEARFAGRVVLDPGHLAGFSDVAHFAGPVPRLEMADLFRWADVFALPSIVEGSATSSYEALLTGLPLIVTPNTGSIISGDDAGQIVPPGDSSAIAAALLRYHENPELLAQHKERALALRGKAATERYGRELAALVSAMAENPAQNHQNTVTFQG